MTATRTEEVRKAGRETRGAGPNLGPGDPLWPRDRKWDQQRRLQRPTRTSIRPRPRVSCRLSTRKSEVLLVQELDILHQTCEDRTETGEVRT